MGNLYRWGRAGLLAALFLIAGQVTADTYQATSVYYAADIYKSGDWGSAFYASSPQESCTLAAGASWVPSTFTGAATYNAAGPSCNKWSTAAGVYGRIAEILQKYTCPYGGTLSGTSCVNATCDTTTSERLSNGQCVPKCGAGYDRNASGQCVKDCTAKAGQPTTNGNYSFSGAVSTWSVSECRVSCAQRVLTAYGGSGYECKYTGASATPDDTSGEALPPDPEKLPPEKPEDCLNRGSGYVQSSSGKITCVPSSEAPEGQKPNKKEADNVKESGTKNPDGTIDKTSPDYKKEETTTSQGSDGTTTTNKKETVAGTNDGNGNVTCPAGYTKNPDNTCSKTTTSQQTNAGFCEQNPNSPLCKEAKESRFGGGCDSGFVCEGDAATCASARASHELKCSFQPDSTTGLHDAENPGGTGSQVAKAAEALNADGTKDFNIASEFSSKNQQWVNFSSGCPVGVQQFSILGKTLEVDASIVCDIGLFIRLMVHIVAYLGLARVFATKLV